MAAGRPDRGSVWKALGAPTEQIGSVNDPRTAEEFGATWNEKWIYCDPEGEGWDRVVLWKRYDLAGIFRVLPDGRAEPEALPQG